MSTSGSFATQTVVVSGGASGLGRACAEELLQRGATVVLSDLDGEQLGRATKELSALGKTVPVPADITLQSDCVDLMEAAASAGRVTGVVVAAGVFDTEPFATLTEAAWRRIIDVDLTGSFLITQAAGNALVQSGGGSIVLFSSVAGRSGRPLAAHYAAAKAGVLSLTKSASAALAPTVRVNAVCPGLFRTPMWDQIIAERDELEGPGAGQNWLDEVTSASLLGRAGEFSELAKAITFLLSDEASFVTGQAINVDGGLEFN